MLPIENINALKVIHALLALQGVPVEPKDTSDVERVQNLLSAYTIKPILFSESERFRSFFGKYNIENCQVEIMSGLEIFKDNTWFRNESKSQNRP